MPENQGNYGGPGRQGRDPFSRQVRTPGSGSVRRAAPGAQPVQQPRPARPAAAPAAPAGQRRQPPAAPRRPQPYSGARYPDAPNPPAYPAAEERRPAEPARPVRPEQARAAARRARAQRRLRRRLALLGIAACILLLAGVITALLPETRSIQAAAAATAEAAQTSAVAPLPYAGTEEQIGGGTAAAEPVQLDWGTVGPARQESYTYTAAPEKPTAVPAFGRVDSSWFADAAFLGDSLTAGFTEYDIDVGGALVCGYEGTSPNQIVNRTVLNHPARGEEVPLDVLAAAQPKKLYVLMGTNALVGTGNDEGFLNYYSRMLDALRETLPDATIFVQSILPVRPEALENAPGLASDRLATINAALAALCGEKGCLYLDLQETFADETGALNADVAEADGIHLRTRGYTAWVDYLCTHVPYSKANPYQAGSDYYLTDTMKTLLSDLG